MTVVVKIGSSSLTTPDGAVRQAAIATVCDEVATLINAGTPVVIVTSGAIAAGLEPLGLAGRRPGDMATLQAVSSVGQPRLMDAYARALAGSGLVAGQVLLAPLDFSERQQYLHARQTLAKLLELGVVPIVNENDATADDEIRFGDNDRLGALVAHMVGAETLVILTDTSGVYTADPRLDAQASLIEEVAEIDHAIEAVAGGPGSAAGSGGMTSKLAAAKIAAWSGIRTVIADASAPGVVAGAVRGDAGIGTVVRPRVVRLSARKLWLAFAVTPAGRITVDDGARTALVERGSSLLPAGVVSVTGSFDGGAVVEVAGPDGEVFAKGITAHASSVLSSAAGRRSVELPEDTVLEVIHRDDMVLLV